ncbi:unnamed protein product [Cuscuta epithymum]|uniref:Uncharacterized protein n=1 Tax=Cuscuta epithymum TaxID=186058 RepID=A0AAV0E3C2_9ASTE|nr:unnamed protein product [Cuscuta epithymum]
MKAGALAVEHRIGGASVGPVGQPEVSEALRDGERVSLPAPLLEEAQRLVGVVGVAGHEREVEAALDNDGELDGPGVGVGRNHGAGRVVVADEREGAGVEAGHVGHAGETEC